LIVCVDTASTRCSKWAPPVSGAAQGDRSASDRSLDLSLVLGELVADIVGVEDHCRALMAPKPLTKSKAMAGKRSPEAVLEVRAVAA
jgi:hypothetical protein